MQTLLRKWWVILVQGILLIILSIYVFNHPGATLLSITFWISLLILCAGLAGVLGWLLGNAEQRENSSLLWSIASALFGLLLITKIGFAMDLLTNLLGVWMIMTGAWLAQQGWANRSNGSLGWITLILGLLSMIAGVLVIFNITAGAAALSTIVGLQLLFAGIALIALALIKKKVVGIVKDKITEVREKLKH